MVTNPDRAAGRGRRLRPPPVKTAATDLGLPVLQPDSPRNPSLAEELRAMAPDALAVVAYSILPEGLLRVPRLGSVNVHPSLLPAYRGAAPIVWALFEGCTETGVTTFLLNRRVDAGDILLQERVAVGGDETAGELEARLAEDGARLLVRSLDGMEDGSLHPRPQPKEGMSRAPKLTREDGRIDWGWPAGRVRNRVRGANPMPGAFTEWSGGVLKVHRVELAEVSPGAAAPGEVLRSSSEDGVVVACADGAVRLTEVQPAGRPRMPGEDFARGYRLQAGDRLGGGERRGAG